LTQKPECEGWRPTPKPNEEPNHKRDQKPKQQSPAERDRLAAGIAEPVIMFDPKRAATLRHALPARQHFFRG
jgi:hypothetical protein